VELPEKVRKDLVLIPVSSMDEVLRVALAAVVEAPLIAAPVV